jgi:hypothetical protein
VGGISADAHLVLEVALGRLGGHIDAGAGRVELPAVVDAAQTGLFVASEEQRCAAVGTGLREESDLAVRVAECDEVLAEEAYAERRAVRLRHFARQQRRCPVAAQQVAHHRAGADLREELVLFL